VNHLLIKASGVALAVGLAGCATPPTGFDYSAFIQAKPASLLVLPPLNDSPDVNAPLSVWAQATRPLAEAGYYVLPVTLVAETFRQNGLDVAADIQDVPIPKLREFFGADAAVFLRVKQYGTRFVVFNSDTRVEVEARIVDLRSGQLLWQGQAVASSSEQQQQSQGGLLGALVAAVVTQIINTSTDAAYKYADVANQRLLGAPRPNGILPGPRSPFFGRPPNTAAR
jgi:hypothetical protein